jgi:hypothetical protein
MVVPAEAKKQLSKPVEKAPILLGKRRNAIKIKV